MNFALLKYYDCTKTLLYFQTCTFIKIGCLGHVTRARYRCLEPAPILYKFPH